MSYQPPSQPDWEQPLHGQPPPPPKGTPPPPPQYGTNVYSIGMAVHHYGATNGAATTAMWFGIFSFICPPVALGALIAGFVGLSNSKQLAGLGRGKSIFGIIMGCLWLLGVVLFMVLASSGIAEFEQYN